MRRARLVAIAAAAVAAVGVSACGGDDGESTTAASGCEQVEAPPPRQVDIPPPKAEAPTASGIAFTTSCGDFEVTFDDRAPKTAASFQYLAEEGVYDGTPFHRVIPDQLVQGGDPAGDGTGGPGYSVDERPPGNLAYTQGTVAMAKTSVEPVGRSESQFFVVLNADLGLTPDYALVGEVTSGLETLQEISSLGRAGADGPPTMPVVIETATPIE